MDNPIHTEMYRDHRIKIFHDTDPENPRNFETYTTMTCWHRRYRLGDPHTFETPSDFLVNLAGVSKATTLGMDALLMRARRQAIILPLYLYDHSGITMNTIGFHCPWDSGQVGFIHVTRVDARSAYGVKRLSPQRSDHLEKLLVQDVVTYDAYLTVNCFGFIIEKDDEETDSCWGFLGHYETHCLPDARASIDAVFGT